MHITLQHFICSLQEHFQKCLIAPCMVIWFKGGAAPVLLNCSCCKILFHTFFSDCWMEAVGNEYASIRNNFWSIKLTRSIQVIKVNLQHAENVGGNLNTVSLIASSAAEWKHFPSNFDMVIIQNTRQSLWQNPQFIWLQPTTCKNLAFLWPVNMVQLLFWL